MCGGHSDDKQALADANVAAARAKAQATAALAAARKAATEAASATQDATSPGGGEKGRDAAEAEMRKRLATGTYTKNFFPGAGAAPPSIAYTLLQGQ